MMSIEQIVIVLFITLGPLKVIPTFAQVAQNADLGDIRRMAWESAAVATGIAMAVAVLFSTIMTKWGISEDALRIAGGILLFGTSVKAVTRFTLPENRSETGAGKPPEAGAAKAGSPPGMHWMRKPVLSPLVIPSIISPISVVAILLLMDISAGNTGDTARVIIFTLLIMLLNLISMRYARLILKYIGLAVLLVVGWIMQILMSALAVQMIVVALRHYNALP